MLTFIPVGWMGLVMTGLIAAYMSTISTHLNWGSSYLVNDVYKRFLKPDSTQKDMVNVGRISTFVLMVLAGGLALLMESALDNFQIILQIGAGTGLIFILRRSEERRVGKEFRWRLGLKHLVKIVSERCVDT